MSDVSFDFSNHAVEEAIRTLKANGARSVQRKTRFQIKVGPFNFYPAKGTIFHDGDQMARQERGLEAFISLLRKGGFVSPPAPAAPAAPATPAVRLVIPDDGT